MNLAQSLKASVLRLLCFALATAALLGFCYEFTYERIAEQERLAALKIYDELVPRASYNNDLLTSTTEVPDDLRRKLHNEAPALLARQNKELVAIIMQTDALDGYSGRISLIIAIAPDGQLIGTRVVKHAETPGLGDGIELRISDWILSFNGLTYTPENDTTWFIKKQGGQFDQFTGATITPKAVVNQVRKTMMYVHQNQKWLEELN